MMTSKKDTMTARGFDVGMPLQDIEASSRSFCALLADGQVVAWGDPAAGGDCSQVQVPP